MSELKAQLDFRLFYETLARIIGEREGVKIRVVSVRERKPGEPRCEVVENSEISAQKGA